jgi:hypothetical protein
MSAMVNKLEPSTITFFKVKGVVIIYKITPKNSKKYLWKGANTSNSGKVLESSTF